MPSTPPPPPLLPLLPAIPPSMAPPQSEPIPPRAGWLTKIRWGSRSTMEEINFDEDRIRKWVEPHSISLVFLFFLRRWRNAGGGSREWGGSWGGRQPSPLIRLWLECVVFNPVWPSRLGLKAFSFFSSNMADNVLSGRVQSQRGDH